MTRALDSYTTLACYNYYTPPGPNGSSGNDLCGCVGTALAQFMFFTHSTSPTWLNAGVGTVSFFYYIDGVKQPSVDLRGGDGKRRALRWNDMVSALIPAHQSLQRNARRFGALCYDAGVLVHMNYTSYDSYANAVPSYPL